MRSLYLASLAALSLAATGCNRNVVNDNIVDQTYLHKYGVAVPSDYWNASGQDGAVVSSMADGVVVTRSYAGGLQDGETTYTFPHREQIQKREFYRMGTLVKEVVYFLDGTPQSEIVYDSPVGIKKISIWYCGGSPKSFEQYSGNLLFSGKYYTPSNMNDACVDNYSGIRIVRDDFGLIVATDTIEGGTLMLRTTYHPNNAPKELITYKNGLADGIKKSFHPSGEPDAFEEWRGGRQHGTTVVYQNGEKYAEVPYVNGQKHGTEQRYRDGQTLVQEISWDNGQMHGPVNTYIGDWTKTDWYYRDNLTTEVNYNFMVDRPIAR